MIGVTTRTRNISSSHVKSVIQSEKNVFHVISYFDQKVPLADLLFAAANENLLCKNRDISPATRYTFRDD